MAGALASQTGFMDMNVQSGNFVIATTLFLVETAVQWNLRQQSLDKEERKKTNKLRFLCLVFPTLLYKGLVEVTK